MASSVPPAPRGAPPVVDPDILHGWKEIAAFAGKSVRTVQRWERDLGLPVRRLGPDREIIVALRSEVSEWLRQVSTDALTGDAPSVPAPDPVQAPPPAVPGLQWLARLAALASVAGLVVWLAGAWPQTGPLPPPADWRVVADTLSVLDEKGRVIWTYASPKPLDAGAYTASRDGPSQAHKVRFVDLEGDGRVETLFVEMEASSSGSRLIAFDSGGKPRFTWAPGRVRFGTETYQGPWILIALHAARQRDGTTSIWPVFAHRPWFPSVIAELGPDGRSRGEYWSGGYVIGVHTGSWNGRDVVVAGGVNNELAAASVAVIDRQRFGGAAPALDPRYRCTSCGPATPDAFLVFPRVCLTGVKGEFPAARTAWFDESGRMVVEVVHGAHATPQGMVLYTIDAALSSARAEFVPGYAEAHRALERAGTLDHAFGASCEAQALPVRKWTGTAFVPLGVGPVTIPR